MRTMATDYPLFGRANMKSIDSVLPRLISSMLYELISTYLIILGHSRETIHDGVSELLVSSFENIRNENLLPILRDLYAGR
jgi:hypothetical protein